MVKKVVGGLGNYFCGTNVLYDGQRKWVDSQEKKLLPVKDRIEIYFSNFYHKNIKPLFKKQKTIESSVL